LYVRGIAELKHLLSDGGGPAYYGDTQELTQALRRARAAAEGSWRQPGGRSA